MSDPQQKPYILLHEEEDLAGLPEKFANLIREGKAVYISKRPEATSEEMIKAVNEDFA